MFYPFDPVSWPVRKKNTKKTSIYKFGVCFWLNYHVSHNSFRGNSHTFLLSAKLQKRQGKHWIFRTFFSFFLKKHLYYFYFTRNRAVPTRETIGFWREKDRMQYFYSCKISNLCKWCGEHACPLEDNNNRFPHTIDSNFHWIVKSSKWWVGGVRHTW